MNIIRKIIVTPRTLLSRDTFQGDGGFLATGKEIRRISRKLFRGSLAIRVVTAGSTNACEQELVALGNSYYDVERFGIHFVASPRHADMLLVTGPVTRNMKDSLVTTYAAMPDPKIVVALGDDAIDGGIFKGSYAVLDGAAGIIPVDYQIPGDPPSPGQIIGALLAILRELDGAPAKTGAK